MKKIRWIAPLFARVTVGYLFLVSGWGKLQGMERVIAYFQSLGIPAAPFQAHLVAYTELGCGLLLILGLLTRLASIPLIVTMTVALLTARRAEIHGFADLGGMIEFLYIVILVWLITDGAGAVSADRAIKTRFSARPSP